MVRFADASVQAVSIMQDQGIAAIEPMHNAATDSVWSELRFNMKSKKSQVRFSSLYPPKTAQKPESIEISMRLPGGEGEGGIFSEKEVESVSCTEKWRCLLSPLKAFG